MPKFEYAPAPESRAIVTIEKSYGLFIDGAFTRPKATFPTINPADETVLAEVSQAGPKDVDKAVAAARRAYDGVWGRMSGAERGKYLFRIARILQERAREFAVLETLDNGKPIKETRDVDVPRPRRTSSTTRAGPTSWSMPACPLPGARPPRRTASSGRSSRGTSRCSCSRGRSRRPWPPATPSCSSPPRPRR